MAKRKKKRGSSVSVDFTGVEAGGGKIKPGSYVCEVESVMEEEGQESGKPYLAWVFKVTEGKAKGRKLFHNTSLQPQALFNLRNLLEAMGVEVPDGEMDLDLDDLVGEAVGVEVEEEEYQGKKKARVVGFFNASDAEDDDDDDDDDEEDEAPKKKSKSKKKRSRDEDEDEDSDDDDDDEDDSDDDEDDSDDDEDDSDDDEEDEKPTKKKRRRRK